MSKISTMASQRAFLLLLRLGAVLGLVASLYAMYVEGEIAQAAALGHAFTGAACDIGSWSRCSKVLTSSYSRVLSHWGFVPRGSVYDLSNAAMGTAFYAVALVHDVLPLPLSSGTRQLVMLVASTGSLAFTGYLAYVLKFVLQDFCLVCATMYVANALIFIGAARRALAGTRTQAAPHQSKAHAE